MNSHLCLVEHNTGYIIVRGICNKYTFEDTVLIVRVNNPANTEKLINTLFNQCFKKKYNIYYGDVNQMRNLMITMSLDEKDFDISDKIKKETVSQVKREIIKPVKLEKCVVHQKKKQFNYGCFDIITFSLSISIVCMLFMVFIKLCN